MYLKALTHGLTEMPATDHTLRSELSALPSEEVLQRLNELDPAASEVTDMRNPRRVQRALEIVIQTGRPIAESRGLWDSRETPGFRGILLTRTMDDLLARIEARSEEMLRSGAIEEVRQLQNAGSTARMAIGLREIESLIEGRLSETECRSAITLATRRYAKRQLTWFRNQFNFSHIDLTALRNLNQSPESAVLEALDLRL
jgi:tRNA dimethylallyltransferase